MLSAKGPPEFFAIGFLKQLPRTADGNQYAVAMTDKNSKLTQSLSSGKTPSASVANVFFVSWIVPNHIPAYFLTNSEIHFTRKLFTTICTMLGLKHLTANPCHPHGNGQIKSYNRTTFTWLRRHDSENQQDRDKYAQLSKYAYNTQVLKSSNFIFLVLYYLYIGLDTQPCRNQVVWPLTTMLRLIRDGYASTFDGGLQHCRPKPIRICGEGKRSISTTKSRGYSPNRGSLPVSDRLYTNDH